jgi:hypothetical protein
MDPSMAEMIALQERALAQARIGVQSSPSPSYSYSNANAMVPRNGNNNGNSNNRQPMADPDDMQNSEELADAIIVFVVELSWALSMLPVLTKT